MTVYHRFDSGVTVLADLGGTAGINVWMPENGLTAEQADQMAADLREAAELARILMRKPSELDAALAALPAEVDDDLAVIEMGFGGRM